MRCERSSIIGGTHQSISAPPARCNNRRHLSPLLTANTNIPGAHLSRSRDRTHTPLDLATRDKSSGALSASKCGRDRDGLPARSERWRCCPGCLAPRARLPASRRAWQSAIARFNVRSKAMRGRGVVSTAQGSPKGASVGASPAQPSKSLGRTITPRLARCGAAAAASKTNCRVRGFAAPSLVFWSMATRPREPTAAQPCAPPVAPTPAKPASPPNSQHPLAEHQGNV